MYQQFNCRWQHRLLAESCYCQVPFQSVPFDLTLRPIRSSYFYPHAVVIDAATPFRGFAPLAIGGNVIQFSSTLGKQVLFGAIGLAIVFINKYRQAFTKQYAGTRCINNKVGF